MNTNRILILVQGITSKDYILSDVLSYLNEPLPPLQQVKWSYSFLDGLAIKVSHSNTPYQHIISIDTEKLLFNHPIPLVDKLGDWVTGFRKNKIARVREALRNIVDHFSDCEIDIIGHSYGAQSVLGSEVTVRKVILCGAPLTSKSWYVRTKCEKDFEKFKPLTVDAIYYLWNSHDFICHQPMTDSSVINIQTSKGHEFYDVKKRTGYLPRIDDLLSLRKTHESNK